MSARVTREVGVATTTLAEGVIEHVLVAPLDDSALSLSVVRLLPEAKLPLGRPDHDLLLYCFAGSGTIELETHPSSFEGHCAGLLRAGEEGTLRAGPVELATICALVGPDTDRHAPLGSPETVARSEESDRARATGARSFQVFFGPHNGSTRATLFAGFIPPGRAPWHYHLYDEIVWVPTGPGRLHLEDRAEEIGGGSAFRLRPREAHIVENPSASRELLVLGVFTPAGSPSAAYLRSDLAASLPSAGHAPPRA
jgi:quercetin dioxygenase-like cupin family protein